MYLKRNIDTVLEDWKNEIERKPLLLRGARQVGKSSVVQNLGESFDYFLEINFEEHKEVHVLFDSDLSPKELCENLSVLFDTEIEPSKTLLFLDEIQACKSALTSLRFFYEKMPELHVIGAGSLLEFALAELPSFGVGRIRFIFLYPLSFDEFLLGIGQDKLLQMKSSADTTHPLPDPIHKKLINYFKKFLILGGMPEVLKNYAQGKSIQACQRILDDLVISYQTDFAKYKARVPDVRIREVFESVVSQSGGKFVYKKAGQHLNNHQIKEALQLLIMAGLVIPVTHTSANGLPLGAETNAKKRKMLLFDTGIFQRILKLDIGQLIVVEELEIINKGGIAEQYCGLELIKNASCYEQTSLYYWHREALNSSAEIDYLLQIQSDIVPLEVKSGTKGSMNSMFLFLKEKKRKYGIRLSLENFSSFRNIKVIPLYALSTVGRMNANPPTPQ